MASAADARTALHRFGLERDRLTAAIAHAAGVAPTDLAAIEHLEASGPLAAGELAQRLLLTRGSVTALLDRLARSGWVRRVPHAQDRRSVLVELTSAATETGARHAGDYEEAVVRAARRLSAQERAAVARFLDDCAAAAAEKVSRLG